MLERADYSLYKFVMPHMKQEFFKNKLISLCAIAYICIYSLPRKYFLHYFRGNGESVFYDTQEVIVKNHVVFHNLFNLLEKTDKTMGALSVNQLELLNPYYRYSIGSFRINYRINNNVVELGMTSNYSYNSNDNRITIHLHNWLNSFKERGNANDFKIIGKKWIVSLNELNYLYRDLGIKRLFNNKKQITPGELGA